MSVLIKIKKQVFTVTIASPAVFSLTAHGFVAGTKLYFTTTGALPTGLVAGTGYYVIAAGLTANAFEVSATAGGSAINSTGSQSGVHSVMVDHSLDVDPTSFNLSRALTNQVDTVKFNVIRKGGAAGGGYKPSLLDDIIIQDGSQVLLGGQITEIDAQVVDASDIEVFTCTAKDYSYDLDATLVIGTYQSTTVNALIAAMGASFFPTYDLTNVNCPLAVNFIAFNYEYPSSCLQQLADLVNYDWYVDANKKLYFFAKGAYPSPFNLTDTSGNYYFNTLVLKNNLTSLRNSVIVRGGQYLGSLTSEVQLGNGNQKTFVQGYQYNTVFVKVNGVSKTVGIANIDDPLLFDCLYNFQEKFVVFPAAVTAAQTVEVGGLPYIPVIVKVRDTASVALYGEHQFKIIDNSIDSKQGARDRALAELTAYANTISEGTFQTNVSGLDTGQQINIQSDIRGTNTNYVISRISTTMTNGQEFLHTITLVTTSTYGMLQFLMDLLVSKNKEIVINAGEVTDEVESATEVITTDDGTPVVSISHNPQSEAVTVTESNTVQALNYAVEFDAGDQVPSGFKRQFILDGSPLG